MEEKQYKLYAGIIQPVPKGIRFSYIPSNFAYLCVFTDEPPQEGKFTPIEETAKMPYAVRQWLLSCKMQVNTEFMKAKEQENAELLNKFLDMVEEELKKPKEVKNGN